MKCVTRSLFVLHRLSLHRVLYTVKKALCEWPQLLSSLKFKMSHRGSVYIMSSVCPSRSPFVLVSNCASVARVVEGGRGIE